MENYSFFLFSQLYNDIMPQTATEMSYYELFYEVSDLYNEYVKSTYNDSNEPEYECMVNYLSNKKTILINS